MDALEVFEQIDVEKASKAELKAALNTVLPQLKRLRDSVERLLKQSHSPAIVNYPSRDDDFVPAGWTERHGIEIPRADGILESATAWVRIKHGVIVGAGLKNQSILSLMVSMELVPEGSDKRARTYIDWRVAFLSKVDPAKWTPEEGRGEPEAWTKEDRYSKLQRRVGQDHIAAMDCIVAMRPKSKHLAAFHAHQAEFVEAFRSVARVMADIDREAEEASRAARAV